MENSEIKTNNEYVGNTDTLNSKWLEICNLVIQHAIFEQKNVQETIQILKDKYTLIDK